MTPDQLAAIAARNAATTELPDDLRVPLHELQADVHSIIMRVALDGSLASMVIESIETKLSHIAEAAYRLNGRCNDNDAKVARLTAVIEHDRSKVVDVLAEANAVIKNYGWLADGRGSYAFDDDRWKDEFRVCMDSLAKVLDPMRGIASDLSDSPIKWADIVAARSMTDALAEAEKRPFTPKVLAELIRGKVARMGRLEEMQENTRFYSEGDWSVIPGNIPRSTKPCIVIRLTEDEAAELSAMVKP